MRKQRVILKHIADAAAAGRYADFGRAVIEHALAQADMPGIRAGKPDQALQGQELEQMAALDAPAARFLQAAAARLAWSARSTHRALKVARTIADLSGCETVGAAHVAEAVQYRRVLRAPA